MICNARFGHGIRSCGRRCGGRACAIRPLGSERGMCAERRQFGRRNPPAGTAVYEKKESAVPRANIGDSPDSEEIFFEFFSGQELDCDSDTPRTDCPGDDDRKKAAPHLEHNLVFIVQRVDKKDSKIILQGRLHP